MFNSVIGFITKTFQFMRLQDYIDILIVAYVIYHLINLIKQTRTMQLLRGILVLVVALQFSAWFQLHMINYILRNTMQVGFIALFIVFQPELRRALEQIGRSKFGKIFNFSDEDIDESIEHSIEQVASAVKTLSETHTGALIVMERETKISDIIRTGITLNSHITAELLINIFEPNTPLHDGAVIIRDNQIMAAGCFLPLTQNPDLNTELGTRHRAALGISETSDAIVVVVSEETGKISIAMEGSLTRNLTVDSLKRALVKVLFPDNNNVKAHKKLKLWGKKS